MRGGAGPLEPHLSPRLPPRGLSPASEPLVPSPYHLTFLSLHPCLSVSPLNSVCLRLFPPVPLPWGGGTRSVLRGLGGKATPTEGWPWSTIGTNGTHACLGQDCWEPGKALVDTSPQCAASPQTPPQTASSSLSPLSHGFRTHTQHSRPSPAHRFPGSSCPPQAPGLCASPKPTRCPPHPLACSSRPWQRPRS